MFCRKVHVRSEKLTKVRKIDIHTYTYIDLLERKLKLEPLADQKTVFLPDVGVISEGRRQMNNCNTERMCSSHVGWTSAVPQVVLSVFV